MRFRVSIAGLGLLALSPLGSSTPTAQPFAQRHALRIRGRADQDFWGNDSAYVQFSGSVTGLGAPMWRVGTASATTYTLEDCTGCGLKNWGWNDNASGAGALGPVVYFAADGVQTIRIQIREDGLSIDQIVLSPERFSSTAPGATKNDNTIVAR